MLIARFTTGDGASFGVVEGDSIAVDGAAATIRAIEGHPFAPFQVTGEPVPLADVRLLAPVLPSKIVAIGRNYADHVSEMGGESNLSEPPVVFLKPSTAVIGPGDPIQYPVGISSDVHFEGELAVVISRLCRDVPAERAADVVLGFTCANDVTARDLQRSDQQWGRAKGFDTFCPLGPWIATGLDPSDLSVTTTVNGELRQAGRTSQLMRGVDQVVAHITAAMTLLPGDVILTGTPGGVGPLAVGDEVSVTIERVGTLTNTVVARG